MSQEKIKEKIIPHLSFLRKKYHVKKVGFFGSYSKGKETQKSDVDIMVELEYPIGFFDFIRLEDFLGKTLNKKVDLVTRKALKPAIKDEILKEVVYVKKRG